jgi:MoaA/NifB/PqqE/SkfB family radical SAM enzyme
LAVLAKLIASSQPIRQTQSKNKEIAIARNGYMQSSDWLNINIISIGATSIGLMGATEKILGKAPFVVRTHVFYSPIYLNIAITNMCNLSCTMCFRHFMPYHKTQMELATFKKTINQLPKVRHVNFCGIGEPLLHPDFFEMLALIRKNTKATISFSTNGKLLNEENIKKLIGFKIDKISVSMDGTGEVYESIRKTSFDALCTNLKLLKNMKQKLGSKKPMVEAEFVCMQQNIKTLPNEVDLLKGLGCQSLYLLHPFCFSQETFESQHLHNAPNQEEILQILETVEQKCKQTGMGFRGRLLEPKPILCYEPWYQLTVTEDGTIRPCCFVGILYSPFNEQYSDTSFACNPEHVVLGRIDSPSIEKVWKGAAYKNLRKHLLQIQKQQSHDFSKQSYVDLRTTSPKGDYCRVCQFRFQTAC